jgi:hypothetical protein
LGDPPETLQGQEIGQNHFEFRQRGLDEEYRDRPKLQALSTMFENIYLGLGFYNTNYPQNEQSFAQLGNENGFAKLSTHLHAVTGKPKLEGKNTRMSYIPTFLQAPGF